MTAKMKHRVSYTTTKKCYDSYFSEPTPPPGILKVLTYEELLNIKEKEKTFPPYMGTFYVIEYNDGVKIGSSKQPYTRYRTLQRNAEKYGNSSVKRIAISTLHTNYLENEHNIQKYFEAHRIIGTELFDIPFYECVEKINQLNISLLDESQKKQERAHIFFEGIKNFALGRTNTIVLNNKNEGESTMSNKIAATITPKQEVETEGTQSTTTALSLLREEEFLDKTVRVFGTPENPLFLARDVAEWIEHSDVSMMMKKIDDDEKVTNNVCTPGEFKKLGSSPRTVSTKY